MGTQGSLFRDGGIPAGVERSRLPPTKGEIREVIYSRLERGEALIFKQLVSFDSVSVSIVVRVKLTRCIVMEAYRQLRSNRQAQVVLTKVLGAARYKFPHMGHLLAVKCPKCRRERDSFLHMLRCYDLQEGGATGVHAIDFLGGLAVKVTTAPPNVVFPIMTEP